MNVSICCVVLTMELHVCIVMTILFSTFLINGSVSEESHVSDYSWLDTGHLIEARFSST